MINLKIDVKKITKSKLYVGAKGTYLTCTLIPTPQSEYGDYMIVESISKEDRDNGLKGVILGNAKEFKPEPKPESDTKPNQSTESDPEEDLPF